MAGNEQRMLVFVGSYAEASTEGIYVYEFDEQTGELKRLDSVSGLKNPTFLNVDPVNRKLYTIEESFSDGGKVSDAYAYDIDPVTGKLNEISKAYVLDGPACHIQRRADNKYITVTSYHKGTVGLVKLEEGGKIGEVLDIQQHVGSSVHENQQAPHPHSSFFSPDNRFLFVCDLGIDKIRAYHIDEEAGKLIFHRDTDLQPGSGPRHLAFHPTGAYAYVINELNSTVTVYQYDAEQGILNEIQTISTMPEGDDQWNGCAEITVSADGRYVYGSNRGHDSIVVYAVDAETGKLTLVQHISTEGGHPRHFSILPGGKHMIVANRDANNMTLFKVDQDSGKLTYTGYSVEVSKPVCVWGYRM